MLAVASILALTSLSATTPALAATLDEAVPYWSLFNVEGESSQSAQLVTYASLDDMLLDQNRTGVFTPDDFGFGKNVVGAGSDGSSYWLVFNVEGESSQSAQLVTYASLDDMLLDQNRTGVFTPDDFGFGKNVVGAGSDGSSYWLVFNVEGESSQSAQLVTYASLDDMLLDQNRTGVFTPDDFGFGKNVVGAGSDGSSYWLVFNVEGESSQSAQLVTYASLDDMLLDQNRTGVFTPDDFGFGRNIVGSGAFAPTDADGDGVEDVDDLCAGTVLGDGDRPATLRPNRYYADDDGVFVDSAGTSSGYTVLDTGGCSATQILAATEHGQGQRFGLTTGALRSWVVSIA
jgi:hypothetical protein